MPPISCSPHSVHGLRRPRLAVAAGRLTLLQQLPDTSFGFARAARPRCCGGSKKRTREEQQRAPRAPPPCQPRRPSAGNPRHLARGCGGRPAYPFLAARSGFPQRTTSAARPAPVPAAAAFVQLLAHEEDRLGADNRSGPTPRAREPRSRRRLLLRSALSGPAADPAACCRRAARRVHATARAAALLGVVGSQHPAPAAAVGLGRRLLAEGGRCRQGAQAAAGSARNWRRGASSQACTGVVLAAPHRQIHWHR